MTKLKYTHTVFFRIFLLTIYLPSVPPVIASVSQKSVVRYDFKMTLHCENEKIPTNELALHAQLLALSTKKKIYGSVQGFFLDQCTVPRRDALFP